MGYFIQRLSSLLEALRAKQVLWLLRRDTANDNQLQSYADGHSDYKHERAMQKASDDLRFKPLRDRMMKESDLIREYQRAQNVLNSQTDGEGAD